MHRRSGWDQAPTKGELEGFASKSAGHTSVSPTASGATEDVVRYARGFVTPGDDDCHLSDHAYLTSPDVADPGAVVSGLQVVKK